MDRWKKKKKKKWSKSDRNTERKKWIRWKKRLKVFRLSRKIKLGKMKTNKQTNKYIKLKQWSSNIWKNA